MKDNAKKFTFEMQLHPVAQVEAAPSEDKVIRLAEDIGNNGLASPILLSADGLLIDGRARLDACELAGVNPAFRVITSEPPSITWARANGDRLRAMDTREATVIIAKLHMDDTSVKSRSIVRAAGYDNAEFDNVRLRVSAAVRCMTDAPNAAHLAGHIWSGCIVDMLAAMSDASIARLPEILAESGGKYLSEWMLVRATHGGAEPGFIEDIKRALRAAPAYPNLTLAQCNSIAKADLGRDDIAMQLAAETGRSNWRSAFNSLLEDMTMEDENAAEAVREAHEEAEAVLADARKVLRTALRRKAIPRINRTIYTDHDVIFMNPAEGFSLKEYGSGDLIICLNSGTTSVRGGHITMDRAIADLQSGEAVIDWSTPDE